MGTLRDIKRRISGVESTKKITRAMKMVASAKLRKAQDSILNARPYAKKISELLQKLLINKDFSNNPLLIQKEGKSVLLVVVTADKGLCGSFNTNLIKEAVRATEEITADGYNVSIYCIGKKGFDYFSKRNFNVVNSKVGVFAGLKSDVALRITDEIVGDYLADKYQKVHLIYNEFKSVIQQKIVRTEYLPIIVSEKEKNDKQEDYIFEPSVESIFEMILPMYLNSVLWRVLLESNAAELGAKMTAMENATTNAQELIRTLKIKYNKERQAAITTEVNEVVSGANALKT